MPSSTPPDRLKPDPPVLNSEDDRPPVVARLVVEIRSDGQHTIARGALEDPDGQRVAIEAQGTTPWMLARALARSLWTLPLPSRPSSWRALLAGKRRRSSDPDR